MCVCVRVCVRVLVRARVSVGMSVHLKAHLQNSLVEVVGLVCVHIVAGPTYRLRDTQRELT